MGKRNIVVIGASAGGFDAIKEIVSGFPADLNASLFIVWHLSPDVTGFLPQVLNKFDKLYAMNARDGEPIAANRIYVAVPDHHLLIEEGRMRVTYGPKENRFRPAIDPLFRSAAYSYGARVIGVVLSGALDDGSSGFWTIKQAAGIAVVQDPKDAQVPAMPQNALNTATVDYCLPASEIAGLLVRLVSESIQPSDTMKQQQQVGAEVAVAAENANAAMDLFKAGKLTPYTCPECGGVLAQFLEGDRPRFRCHTGHAFSSDSLLASITEMVEEGFYRAIRGVDESALLLNHLGDHFAESNDPKLAALYFNKAREAQSRAALVRRALKEHESLTAERLEKEVGEDRK